MPREIQVRAVKRRLRQVVEPERLEHRISPPDYATLCIRGVDSRMSNEVKEMWDQRCADLNLRNSAEEIKQISNIYYMACVDLLDLIRKRLATIPAAQQQAWLDSIYHERDDRLGAAVPAG
jgi:hypothetical protein